MTRPAPPNPAMADPADKSIRRGTKAKPNPTDDLADPADADPDAPHDRGAASDRNFEGAREDMVEHIGRDKKAWKKGRTQNY